MKKRHDRPRLDIYTELFPASSMAIIGCGLITATMGELRLGLAVMLIGLAVGIAGPLIKTLLERKVVSKRKVSAYVSITRLPHASAPEAVVDRRA